MRKIYIIAILIGIVALFGLYASGLIKEKEETSGGIFYKSIADNSQAELKISGMTCASCIEKIQSALKKVSGAKSPKVSLAKQKATVLFNPEMTSSASLVNAINKLGKYRASLVSVKSNSDLLKEEKERIEKSEHFAMNINGKDITKEEFEELLNKSLQSFRSRGTNLYPTLKQREQIVAETANSLIEEFLIQNEIWKGNISVEPKKRFVYQQWISELHDKADIKIYSSEILKAFDGSSSASRCGGSCCS